MNFPSIAKSTIKTFKVSLFTSESVGILPKVVTLSQQKESEGLFKQVLNASLLNLSENL